MSVTHETTIWCNGEGCVEWSQQSGGAAWARKVLARHGWSRGKGRAVDLCPTCTKKSKERSKERA